MDNDHQQLDGSPEEGAKPGMNPPGPQGPAETQASAGPLEGQTPALPRTEVPENQPLPEPAATPADAPRPEGQGPESPETEPQAEPAKAVADSVALESQAPASPEREAPAGEPREWSGRVLRTAAISAAVLLFALAFFAVGYWIGDRQDDDPAASLTSRNASDDPAWGPEDASVTIEEFVDFQCPYCAEFSRVTLPELRERYGDRVRYVIRDFPLGSIHPDAPKAAEAAQCAHDQSLFWEYHDLLFAGQETLSVSDLKRYASQVGADAEQFNTCLDAGQNGWEVLLDYQDGARAGVTGTPAFLINGILLPGSVPLGQFLAIIEKALAGAAD